MTDLPEFICSTCGKSLLLEAHIKLDNKNKQYCPRCWARNEREKITKLGKKYPVGSTIVWINEDIGKAARRTGKVVKCSERRIQVDMGGQLKWIEEESVLALQIPKQDT